VAEVGAHSDGEDLGSVEREDVLLQELDGHLRFPGRRSRR
jgi:hypothetical protein